MTSHAPYWWHHMNYIWYVIYSVWYHIHSMCDITQCLYLWHHTLYIYDISILYGITNNIMTIQSLCNFKATMSDITPTVSVPSHTVDKFYQTQCMYDITATMCMTSYALHVTSHPQFRTSHHFLFDIRSNLSDLNSSLSLSHTHPIDDITATICINSHLVYQWHKNHYIYDIISTSMTSQHSVLMTQHCAYVWHPLHCRWQCTHSITPKHSIYVTSSSGRTAQPLYQTSHPLYLCHHTVSTDISPTFLWHHAHILCDIIWTIYITSHPILMSSHYSTYDITLWI